MTSTQSRRLPAQIAVLRRHLLVGLAFAIAAVAAAGPGAAQPPEQPQQVKQIVLNAKQVESFIASVKEISAMEEKIEQTAKGNPTPQQLAGLDALVKKYGFRDFDEYEDVANSISIVMTGIDPQTKQFTQPPELIKKQIAQVQADKSINPKERKEIIQELNGQLKFAQAVQHPGNVTLVLKYYDKLDAAMQ